MTGFTAAVGAECLKLRRSVVTWVAGAVLAVVVPTLAAGLLAAARSDSSSQLALKARSMVVSAGWEGHLTVTGQILSVAVLVVVGIVACWIFGREFTDGTVMAMSRLPVPRTNIVLAKFAVLIAWAATVTVASAAATVVTGFASGLGVPGIEGWAGLVRLTIAALLTVLLTTPLSFAASIGRGHLTGIAILFSLLVVTQIATAVGVGGWFPYAAPGLWLGLGGPEAARGIGTAQLLLPVAAGAMGIAATTVWWRSLHPTRR